MTICFGRFAPLLLSLTIHDATALARARPLPRRVVLATGAAAMVQQLGPAFAVNRFEEEEDERELQREELEEKQILIDMKKLRKVEKMEEERLKQTRAAQKNRLARATNREDKDKLGAFMTDESILVEADKREIALAQEQYDEGMVAMRAQQKKVENEKNELFFSLGRPSPPSPP